VNGGGGGGGGGGGDWNFFLRFIQKRIHFVVVVHPFSNLF